MKNNMIEGVRLSPQQKRLWKLQQHTGAQPYRAQCVIRLEGSLRSDALCSVLQAIVARHEILRTGFCCLPGMDIPLQVITEEPLLTYLEEVFSDEAMVDQASYIEALRRRESAINWDFERGPLARFCLIKLSAQTHILISSMPALCGDSWTLQNLAREIRQGYEDMVEGRETAG